MRRISAWLIFSLCAVSLLIAIADAAQTGRLIFLSTQLRPIEEAQKMRNLILKGFPREVDYITEQPQQFPVRMEAEEQGRTRTIDVVGALHGELQPLVPLDALVPLDDLAGKLAGRGIPDPLLALGKFGTAHQLYIPWMQASYIMVANKEALPYLPGGADINALSYDQLAAWASTLQEKTGKRLLGFPAGPQGLMHRFFEGLLYPSYTGGIVVPFPRRRPKRCGRSSRRYGRASIRTRPATISCSSRCSPATSGSASTTLLEFSMHCARSPASSSPSPPLPGPRDGATCRSWPAWRC
jgi:multiple sugar transport system substrate-binding protein